MDRPEPGSDSGLAGTVLGIGEGFESAPELAGEAIGFVDQVGQVGAEVQGGLFMGHNESDGTSARRTRRTGHRGDAHDCATATGVSVEATPPPGVRNP